MHRRTNPLFVGLDYHLNLCDIRAKPVGCRTRPFESVYDAGFTAHALVLSSRNKIVTLAYAKFVSITRVLHRDI